MLKWMKEIMSILVRSKTNDLPIKFMQSHSKWAATDILCSLCSNIPGIHPQNYELHCNRHYVEETKGLKLFWGRLKSRSSKHAESHLGSLVNGGHLGLCCNTGSFYGKQTRIMGYMYHFSVLPTVPHSSLEPHLFLWVMGIKLLIEVDLVWFQVAICSIVQGIFNPCQKFHFPLVL